MVTVNMRTYLSPLEGELEKEPSMRFRLTYEGLLRPSGNNLRGDGGVRIAQHKHEIRRVFHRQMKRLWETDGFLRNYRIDPKSRHIGDSPSSAADTAYAAWAPPEDKLKPLVDIVADRHRMYGYRFVPLVTSYFHLLCSLHILFLRHDIPGSAIQAGDIDNRIKTLIDALSIPPDQTGLVGEDGTPRDGEDPFFCLLQDDNLVGGFSVETDTLLNPPCDPEGDRAAKIVVTVELRPYFATPFNLSFV